ncbi:aprataxin isoform X1 [Eurytemora carolleeae]|uniref:aprataxin isoform X1 n=1 Tax=Eurytemora carolleeae TaxID=1294199 RepID=UPI000C78BF46|nr:aprataxin isoform X1 [Eurytemora carolleeae]|eukprot:XP_023322893.1 aprataxin-like isoform X1 [Eurytemora affinis]
MNSRIYYFRSLDGLCPDIELLRDIPLILGRGPVTRVKDTKVSRHQVRVSWDDQGIHLSQTGENPSYLDGRMLSKDEKVELSDGQVLHLVSNKFPFKLILKTDFITGRPKITSSDAENLSGGVKRNSAGEEKTVSSRVDYNHWSHGLLASMKNPEFKVLENEDHVVIKDKYPKSQCHYLVLPTEKIPNLKSLNSTHVALLDRLVETGRTLTARHPSSTFRLGFHAQPSMSQLHLHVISQDFDSSFLKTKKHWNSFTTAFFINPAEVKDKLESKGFFTPPDSEVCKKLLNTPLKCHKCETELKNMPELKQHIKIHS